MCDYIFDNAVLYISDALPASIGEMMVTNICLTGVKYVRKTAFVTIKSPTDAINSSNSYLETEHRNMKWI